MIQPGFFDLRERLRTIGANGGPLTDETVNRETFRPALATAREKDRRMRRLQALFRWPAVGCFNPPQGVPLP